jgi:hypothetical protein
LTVNTDLNQSINGRAKTTRKQTSNRQQQQQPKKRAAKRHKTSSTPKNVSNKRIKTEPLPFLETNISTQPEQQTNQERDDASVMILESNREYAESDTVVNNDTFVQQPNEHANAPEEDLMHGIDDSDLEMFLDQDLFSSESTAKQASLDQTQVVKHQETSYDNCHQINWDILEDDEFEYDDIELNDDDLAKLSIPTSAIDTHGSHVDSSPPLTPRCQDHTVSQGIWYNAAQLQSTPNAFAVPSLTSSSRAAQSDQTPAQDLSSRLTFPPAIADTSRSKPPSSLTDSALGVTDQQAEHVALLVRDPIIRPGYPAPIRDRSVLLGITPSTPLRICFRIGEAINVGVTCIRDNTEKVIELYARVTQSSRPHHNTPIPSSSSSSNYCSSKFTPKRVVQEFTLCDLFHSRPPFLHATFAWWYTSDLWKQESDAFLTEDGAAEPKLCRCVGRLKRESSEDDKEKLTLALLSIKQINWDDIDAVKELVFESAA